MRIGARGAAPLAALVLVACPGPPPAPDIPPCGPDTLATAPPLDMLDLGAVGPMGSVDPSRGQIFPSASLSFFTRSVDPRLPGGEPARVPVVAPGRIWLQRARRSSFIGLPDEFSVDFRVCAEVKWTLKHLVIASPDVRALADDDPGHCGTFVGDEASFCEGTSPGIEMAAGTELGLAGSVANPSLDVATHDMRAQPVSFAGGRLERFTCPLEVFDPATSGALRPLLGAPDGRRRTAEPLCGEYMQDVRGSAQGGWVGTSDGTRLALVHDNVDPGVAVISLSVAFGEARAWRFTPTHAGNIDRDFRELTDDGAVYCYDISSGDTPPSIMLVQADGLDGLRFERQDAAACGAGPWTFHSSFSNSFVRGGGGG
ncbi:MAG TPA: hypothetical protein VFA20_30920 [Myxococcaceae bacterium]|nr:hypothetical protein [Myxococcaceae bacterium]